MRTELTERAIPDGRNLLVVRHLVQVRLVGAVLARALLVLSAEALHGPGLVLVGSLVEVSPSTSGAVVLVVIVVVPVAVRVGVRAIKPETREQSKRASAQQERCRAGPAASARGSVAVGCRGTAAISTSATKVARSTRASGGCSTAASSVPRAARAT